MSHRKIDVDFDDEDGFVEEDGQGISLPELESYVNARAQEVRAYLSRGDVTTAVAKALENPPVGKDAAPLKDRNTQTVMEALQAVKTVEIPQIVKALDTTRLDMLMKYIYRGMASPELYSSAVLLAWHEKVTEVAGLGCIVRVLTDRKTV
ncbi:hypothetical protein HK102_004773 [Quaeritorhiza haematococci]|nr:hypothetical protein HK102_004773 [Quaeritorhiza haematococci]